MGVLILLSMSYVYVTMTDLWMHSIVLYRR